MTAANTLAHSYTNESSKKASSVADKVARFYDFRILGDFRLHGSRNNNICLRKWNH